jgi:site-specific recombinase XerD
MPSPSTAVVRYQPALSEAEQMTLVGFTRDLEDTGKARATIARRSCTICGFYRYAEEEGAIERSPGVHIRRPKVDYESHVVGLDRNEVGVSWSPPVSPQRGITPWSR